MEMYYSEETKQAYDEGYKAGKANGVNAVLGEGWRDASKELPAVGTYCLSYTYGDYYINQVYKGYWETEYPVYENKVVAWQELVKPAFV